MSRRTNKEIERSIYQAASKIAVKKGVEHISLRSVAEEAEMDIGVLNRRFKDDDDLIREYTKRYDFFINDLLVSVNPDEFTSPRSYFESLANVFVKQLHRNKEMQAIMRWEMSYDTALTRRSARKRDELLSEVLPQISSRISPSYGCAPNAILAVLVAGMYYIVLRENRSSFCGIVFNSKEGRKTLSEALSVAIAPFLEDSSTSSGSLD